MIDAEVVPTVATCGSRTFPLEEVQAFFVAYPRGNLLEYHCPGNLPLPPWVRICEPTDALEDDRLSEADLAEGTSIVRVEFGPSTRADSTESRRFYSTRLTNFSTERVRVLKFAATRSKAITSS